MANKIHIRVESQYGLKRNFPACVISSALIKLVGRKTFHPKDLDILREAGFEIILEVVEEKQRKK